MSDIEMDGLGKKSDCNYWVIPENAHNLPHGGNWTLTLLLPLDVL